MSGTVPEGATDVSNRFPDRPKKKNANKSATPKVHLQNLFLFLVYLKFPIYLPHSCKQCERNCFFVKQFRALWTSLGAFSVAFTSLQSVVGCIFQIHCLCAIPLHCVPMTSSQRALHKSIKTSKSNIPSLGFCVRCVPFARLINWIQKLRRQQRIVRKIFLHLGLCWCWLLGPIPIPPSYRFTPLTAVTKANFSKSTPMTMRREAVLRIGRWIWALGGVYGMYGDCQRQRICGASVAACHMSWPPASVNTHRHTHMQRTTVQAQWDQLFSKRVWMWVFFNHSVAIVWVSSRCVCVCVRESVYVLPGRALRHKQNAKMPQTVKGTLLSGQSNVVLKVFVVLPLPYAMREGGLCGACSSIRGRCQLLLIVECQFH